MPVVRTLLALLLATSVGLGAEMRTLSGKTTTGELVAVTEKEVEFSTPAGPLKTPVKEVLDVTLQAVKPPPADVKRIDVEMSDGTQLRCKPDGLVIKGTKVELTLLSGQTVHAGLKDVANFLKDAQDPKLQEWWKAALKKKVKNDRVVVLKSGEPNALDGTLGEADEKGEAIKFKLTATGNTLNFLVSKVNGMIFFRPEPNPLPTVCQVYDTSGDLLQANQVTLGEGGCKVTTALGTKIDLDKQALARLDYNIGKLNFLSDLEPSKVLERAGSGLVTRYRKDHNLDDGPIRLDGKSYPKGLSLHAYTELEYNLDGKYKEFKAFLGVDDLVGGDSKALVTIECDDTKVFSKEITRKTKDYLTNPLVIKVKDVNKLRIIVSSKNILDLHDHVTFADAKVSQ